jgi:hypothetical protein
MSFVFIYHSSREALVSYQSYRKASKNQLRSNKGVRLKTWTGLRYKSETL